MAEIKQYENFESLLASQGEYVTTVRGISMFPLLRYMKDPVRIVPVDRELKRYDIVAYAREDRYVVHRILRVRPDVYIIRGDNCDCREYVPKENIRGVVSGIWRCGKYYPASSPILQIYARIWVAINPLVRICHFVKRVFRKLVKIFSR